MNMPYLDRVASLSVYHQEGPLIRFIDIFGPVSDAGGKAEFWTGNQVHIKCSDRGSNPRLIGAKRGKIC